MSKPNNERPLTLQRLKEVLDYDHINGRFTWRITISPKAPARSEAGCIRKNGRRIIVIDGQQYISARLAWFYFYGSWPPLYVDHINGDPLDDRLENLREAAPNQNTANARSTGATGIKGVHRTSDGRGFQAAITHKGKRFHLGCFRTLLEAAAARKTAALKLHGQFAFEAR